jgi:hypothetical protein
MIGALESCPCDGDLGDFFGRCGGPTMFGRCSALTIRFTHSSAVSSPYASTRQVVAFGLERLLSRRLFPGGRSSASPRGQPAPGSDFGGSNWIPRLHPRCRRVPAYRMELAVKGREGPPLGSMWLAWHTTVMCDADHVICCEINNSRSGQTLECVQNPTTRWHLPRSRPAVTGR